MANRAQTIRKVRNYLIDPETQPPVSPTEMADLVVLVLSQVETIQKAIKEGRLDGKTPVPDKDYLSKTSAQKMLTDAVNGMLKDVDKALNDKGGALEAQVQQALQNIRDGEDGIVTDEEIGRAAQLAANLIDLPDFDEEITKAITSDGAAIRDALELLSGEDRYEVRIEDVNGLEERLQALRTTQGGNTMGTSKLAVYQFIRDAIADGIITTGSSPLTTKGDLYTYSTEDARLPIGANGEVLTADSAEATGMKWATVAGTGDVTAAAAFGTDNRLIRSDGTGKGVQASGITVSDTDAVSGATIDADNNTISNIALGAEATGAINDLSDVTITTPANNEVLAYDGVSAWINQTPSEAGLQAELAEGAFVDGDKTKLDGIETGAEVTSTAKVQAAGALMDSEVDADLKTLSLPANTTISTFGASLVDDADAATARTTLGLGDASTKGVTGTDANAVTGTAGTSGNLAQWNGDGDLVDASTTTTKLRKNRFAVRLVESGTDVATGTTIGGDYRISDEAITIVGVGAYVDTAGTTGVSTIDINEGGTTILSTKITIDSAEKTSETAATAPVISDSSIAADGIITIDVDGVSTTAPQGLVVWIDYYIT